MSLPPDDDVPDLDLPSLDFTFVVGILEIDLRLPLCRSLKEKRGLIARTTKHLANRHPLIVAEVAAHDVWGRAGLAATTVSSDRTIVENILRSAVHSLERDRDVQLVRHSIQIV